jgi:epoxide hydrolase-like predicted phosphatase
MPADSGAPSPQATPAGAPSIEAVLFDFSGVVTTSPWPAMTATAGGDLAFLTGPYHEDTDHPWHRLERGEITLREWLTAVQAAADDAGRTLDMAPLQTLLSDLLVHDDVVEHIAGLRADGYRTALVTNNVREGASAWRAMIPVDDLFDVVVDSSSVGMRKPNPAIFTHTLDLLGGVAPGRAVFLDDVEGNLAGARRAGLHTILVGDPPGPALVELDLLLGRSDGAATSSEQAAPGQAAPGHAAAGGPTTGSERATSGRGDVVTGGATTASEQAPSGPAAPGQAAAGGAGA